MESLLCPRQEGRKAQSLQGEEEMEELQGTPGPRSMEPQAALSCCLLQLFHLRASSGRGRWLNKVMPGNLGPRLG